MAGLVLTIIFGIVSVYLGYMALTDEKRNKVDQWQKDVKSYFIKSIFRITPRILIHPAKFYSNLGLLEKRYISLIKNLPQSQVDIATVQFTFLETNRKKFKRRNEILTKLKHNHIIQIKKKKDVCTILINKRLKGLNYE